MGARRDAWINQTGLNLIRVVIGSYFCAVALGLDASFDPGMIPSVVLPDAMAERVGATILLALALVFVCGLLLRPVSLMLAGFFILSSIGTSIFGTDAAQAASLWQACAFGAAILLCYGPVKPHDIHRSALFSTVALRGGAARVLQKDVSPRRVQLDRAKRDRTGESRSLRPLIAPTDQMIGIREGSKGDGNKVQRDLQRDGSADTEEIDNIFVNL